MTGPTHDVYYGGSRDGQRWELDRQVGDVAYIADPGGDLYTRHPDLDTPQDRAWVHLPTLKPTAQGVYVEPQPGAKFLCLQDLRTLVNTADLMGHPDTAIIHGVTSWSGRMQRLGLKPAEGGKE